MAYSLKRKLNVLGYPTARCMNFRSTPIVQSRNQRDAAARRGSVGPLVVAARETNRSATVGAPATETVETKDCFGMCFWNNC